MRILIDACIDPRVVELFPCHDVQTCFDRGWHGLKDHMLVANIQDRFDVFVTIDRGFEHEHNLRKLKFGILIVHVGLNKLESYRSLIVDLKDAVEQVQPGVVAHVPPRH
jgi:predicted nuclease of predicted toxin-antitoxin system